MVNPTTRTAHLPRSPTSLTETGLPRRCPASPLTATDLGKQPSTNAPQMSYGTGRQDHERSMNFLIKAQEHQVVQTGSRGSAGGAAPGELDVTLAVGWWL